MIQPGYTQVTTIGTTTNAFGAPIPRSWDDAFLTTTILEPVGNANGKQTFLGNAISFFNPNPKVSKQLRWQVGFQRELPGGFVVNAAYVGDYGYDIEIVRNINAVPNQYLNTDNSRTAAMVANNAFLTAAVTNPFAGLVPGSTLNNPTVSRSQLLRPYPEFSDINTTNNDGKSWYNAGQFGVQKRFSKGYTLGVSYTYSRWMQATEYLNPSDAAPTKMISDQDVTNRLSVSGIFEFPFGKGRRFLSGASGITEALLGGWQIQGVYTYQTGFPIPFGSVNATTGIVSNDAFYNGGDIALPSDQRTTAKWFNTDAFTSILSDSSTNATPVNHLRTLPIRFERRAQGFRQQPRPVAPQEREPPGRHAASVEGRVHQRPQLDLLPQPAGQPDAIHLWTGHGFEPGELRPARTDRSEVALLSRRKSHSLQERDWATGKGRPILERRLTQGFMVSTSYTAVQTNVRCGCTRSWATPASS